MFASRDTAADHARSATRKCPACKYSIFTTYPYFTETHAASISNEAGPGDSLARDREEESATSPPRETQTL